MAGANLSCSSRHTLGPSFRTSVTTVPSSSLLSVSGTSTSTSISSARVSSATGNIMRPSTVSKDPSVPSSPWMIVAVSSSTYRSNTARGGVRGCTLAWQYCSTTLSISSFSVPASFSSWLRWPCADRTRTQIHREPKNTQHITAHHRTQVRTQRRGSGLNGGASKEAEVAALHGM